MVSKLCAFVLCIVLTTGCAITREVARFPDGTVVKSTAVVTIGSKITGKDMSQRVAVNADESWEIESGGSVDQMNAEEAAKMFTEVAKALRMYAGMF